MTTPQLIDFATLILLGLSFFNGYKKGFTNIFSKVLSRIAGLLLCKPVSSVVYQMYGNNITLMYNSILSSLNWESVNFPESPINNALGIVGAHALHTVSDKLTSVTCIIIAFALIIASVEIVLLLFKVATKISILGIASSILGGICECISALLMMFFITLILIVLQGINISIARRILNILCQGSMFNFMLRIVHSLM